MSEIDALFQAAKNAREKAHAPYSDFAVGAAILTASGTIHAGCNVENASFPEGWCAETTALGHMVASEGKVRVEAVLVMADAALCTPCGGGAASGWRSSRTIRRRFMSATRRGWSKRSRWASFCPTSSCSSERGNRERIRNGKRCNRQGGAAGHLPAGPRPRLGTWQSR